MLLYESTDDGFAERALAALRAAEIPCYETTTSTLGNNYALAASGDTKHLLFLERPDDYERANAILIQLGAAIDTGPRLPSRPVLFLIVAIAILFALVVGFNWTP